MTDTRLLESSLTDRRIRRLDPDSFRSFVNALMWSVANETEGLINPGDFDLIPDYDPRTTTVLVGAGLLIGDERGWLLVDFEETQTSRDELWALRQIRASNRARTARERANKQNVSADNTALHQTPLSNRLQQPTRLSVVDYCSPPRRFG
jgi:hypothetical protein